MMARDCLHMQMDYSFLSDDRLEGTAVVMAIKTVIPAGIPDA